MDDAGRVAAEALAGEPQLDAGGPSRAEPKRERVLALGECEPALERHEQLEPVDPRPRVHVEREGDLLSLERALTLELDAHGEAGLAREGGAGRDDQQEGR